MAIELVKEPLKINQAVEEELLQFSVQGDVIVPDIKPDIVRVLCIDSDIVVNSKEIVQDKVVAEGMVNFRIIYVCNDEERPVRSLNASLPFKEPLEVTGARQGMKADLDCGIMNTEFDILNERKVLVRAIVQLNVRVTNTVEIDFITDISGIDDIQKLKDSVKVCVVIDSGLEKCVAREEVEIPEDKPPVFEILRNDAKLSKEVKISDNKVIVRGDINVSTLYSGEDDQRLIHTVEYQIPFTQFIDIYGIHEDALCDIDASIKDVYVRTMENADGENRGLEYEITLELEARGFEWIEKETIIDTYCPTCRIDMESKNIVTNQLVGRISGNINLKNNLQLPERDDNTEILSIICRPCVPEAKVMDDKVSVEGVVDVWVMYCVGENRHVMCCKHEVPLDSLIDAKGARTGMTCQIGMEAENCSYVLLQGEEMEVRVGLTAEIKLFEDNKFRVISKVEQLQNENQEIIRQPSMTLYFVQPDDTLWKIGKKYNVTIDELAKTNEISDTGTLLTGQQILVQKRVVQKDLLNKIV